MKIDDAVEAFCGPRGITEENLAYGRFLRYAKKLDSDQLDRAVSALKQSPLSQLDNISAMAWLRENIR